MRVPRLASAVSFVFFVLSSSVFAAPPTRVELKADDGHTLVIWEKKPAHPRAAVLLVHGRTWSALPDFDLQVPGEQRSFMDALVAAGYAAYAIDLRGYGATPRDRTGWLTPDRAAADVAEALDLIALRSGVPGKPFLYGWSLGSLVSQLVAQRKPQLMAGVILFGYPVDPDKKWEPRQDPPEPPSVKNTAEAAADDFITPGVISKVAVDAYVKAALAANPVKADWHMDQFEALDPAQVKIPVLLLQGERDPHSKTDAQARFFTRLGTADRQWVVLPGGDHAALIEDTMPQMIRAMAAFVERRTP